MTCRGWSKSGALALVASLLLSATAFASGDSARGKAVYERYCRQCHGKDGAGDGPAALYLNPPPRDFTLGIYKWKTTPFDELSPSDEDFMRMIKGWPAHNAVPGWDGLNGTSMPGWADVLGDNDTKDVIAYLKSLSGLEAPEKQPIDLKVKVAPTNESIERGKKIFADICAECHGDEGRGDGRKKLKDDWGARTWPRDLTKPWTFRAGSAPVDIYARLTVGVPGTQMPSFADPQSKKALSDDERWDVANYAASLVAPYKKPVEGAVIKALRVEGALPDAPGAEWGRAAFESFYLVPQIIEGERLFTPTLDSVSVKALFNDDEIAFLIEWDDPTNSVPGDASAIDLSDGEVFKDGAAVEFPSAARDEERPHFGMGSSSKPVDIWFWQNDGTVRSIKAKGTASVQDGVEKVSAKGVYEKGRWQVVFKGPLKREWKGGGAQRFVPVAFALWDGSNGEKGGRHTMTGWNNLALGGGEGGSPYAWAAGAVAVVFILELLWLRGARRGKEK